MREITSARPTTMVGLVSCSSQKLRRAAAARELYTSALFQKSLAFAERTCAVTYVVSALHGLVELDQMLEPYDRTLAQMTRHDRACWAARIVVALIDEHGASAEYVVLAGDAYAKPLRRAFGNVDGPGGIDLIHPDQVHEPLAGLQIGERLRWFNTSPARVSPSFFHLRGDS